MIRGKISGRRCARVILLSLLAICTGTAVDAQESLSGPVLDQIRDFLSFRKDDEWIKTQFGILEGICRKEDKKYEETKGIFESFSKGLDKSWTKNLQNISGRFRELSENEVFHLQSVVLYEIESRKSFDPNFFHNLVARSAVNALRLERDAWAAVREPDSRTKDVAGFDSAFDTLRKKLEGMRMDKIPADMTLLDPERIVRLKGTGNIAALRKRISDDTAPFLKLTDISDLKSFFEAVTVIYDEDFFRKKGFFDSYELMQYLLFFESQGVRPNSGYKDGPFNIKGVTGDIGQPGPERPITFLTNAFFEGAKVIVLPTGDPLLFLASHSKQAMSEAAVSPQVWKLYKYLSSSVPGKKGSQTVSQEIYENRLFVLTSMSDQDFYERFRSVRNDTLFFEQAEKKLTISEIKNLLKEPYEVPGGGFILPRYELMGYTQSEFEREQSAHSLLSRIPRAVHIDFIKPLILATYERLGKSEKEAAATKRIKDIAAHFGSPVGIVGDKATFVEFFSLFTKDIEEGAKVLEKEAGITPLEAFKWISILVGIESRGNIFAVSPTGALGPLQHTYYFYLKTPPPSIPFDPKKSAAKTGIEFGKYYIKYKKRYPNEALDMAAAAYNAGPEALEKALSKGDWRVNISDEASRYIKSFHFYLEKIEAARTTKEVADLITKAVP